VTFENQWEEWILFILDAVKFTAEWTEEKICSICSLMEKVGKNIGENFPKIYSPQLMDVIFSQPYCRIKTLVECGIAKRQTAAKYIDALVDCGVLEVEPTPGPEKLYSNRQFIDLLRREN
jgi:Fic family protein